MTVFVDLVRTIPISVPIPTPSLFSLFKPSTIPSVSKNMPKPFSKLSQTDSNSPAAAPPEDDQIDLVWDFLDGNKILPYLVADSPGINTVALCDHVILPHGQDVGWMRFGFAYFPTKDLRPCSLAHNVDFAAKYMNESNLTRFHTTLLNIIHSLLVIYSNCSHTTRSQNQKCPNSILKNIEGFDLCSEESYPELSEAQHAVTSTAKNEHASPETFNISDLQKGIQAMISLFSESSSPNGAENEPFSVRIIPILDQMDALQIPHSHSPSVFSH